MPRKVDPHWNDDAENWDDPDDASPLNTDELAKSIGLIPGTEKANNLNLLLFSIRHNYRSNHKFNSKKYTRAEARRALIEFRGQGKFDRFTISKQGYDFGQWMKICQFYPYTNSLIF